MTWKPDPHSAAIARERNSVSPVATPTPKESRRPTRVGPYRPHALLGSGGMATVYLATGGAQLGNRRWCALKVLHDKLNDQENYQAMFFNEARIASEISHPHVCSVFDYGCANGQTFLAMDFLRGKSLATITRACGTSSDPAQHALRIARILADACEGLAAIHEHRSPGDGELRVVHRDISPDNLLLGFDGFIEVIDFGLAKIGGRGEKTQSGILKGKLSYIAPELLRGDDASPRADIWSLGVVAWELLTGQRLFRKPNDAETLRALAEQPVAPPSEVLPGLPAGLDAVVLRALQRDPTKRYATAAEFGAALWDFLRAHGELVQHRELGRWLSGLFPGEEERIRQRLERLPHTPLSASPAARRPVRLLQHLRIRVGRAIPVRRQSRWLLTGVLAAACCAWFAFRWSDGRGRALPVALDATAASLVSPAFARGDSTTTEAAAVTPLARLRSDSGLIVEIDRSDNASEVTVRVRAARPTDARSAAR